MTKEERAVALGLLVCFLYGLGYLIQDGIFLLPTPLFPLISLLSSGFICWNSFKLAPKIAICFISALTIKLSCSAFLLSFFLNEATFQNFSKSGISELLKVIVYLLILIPSITMLLQGASSRKYYFLAAFLTLFIGALAVNAPYLIAAAYLTVFIYTIVEKTSFSVFGLIPLMLGLFEFSEWIFLQFTS